MRFLILNSDYPQFIEWFYTEHPHLLRASYDEQIRMRVESLFGVADFYSWNLRALGHEAQDIYVNNPLIQGAWAAEHGISHPEVDLQSSGRSPSTIRRLIPAKLRVLAREFLDARSWMSRVLQAQIAYHKPDVLLNQAMDGLSSVVLRKARRHTGMLVGQHASPPLPAHRDFGFYDLVISSFPPTVEKFARMGIPSRLHRLGFDPRVLERLPRDSPDLDVTFVGSFTSMHSTRVQWLTDVARRLLDSGIELGIWGLGSERLEQGSLLRELHRGEVWGDHMYRVLKRSKITLNHHGDVAPHANNLRLYEATGVGTLLITDRKPDLSDIFEVNREVIDYETADECAKAVIKYLDDEPARAQVAEAGQSRTLADHTWRRRMEELVSILEKSTG